LPAQGEALKALVRAHSTSQQLALRARMILHAADNIGVRESARELDVWPKTVRYSCDGCHRHRLRPGKPRRCQRIWRQRQDRVSLFEKAKELAAGRVERALLIFGPVGDERSTFVVEDREHDLACQPLSEPRVLMQFRDDLATENPQVVAVRSQGFARLA
jgi:hypothetical protein